MQIYSDEQEIPKTAQLAFQKFSQGLATGKWDLFLEMLTDDFSFSFPAGNFQGQHIGKAKAADFFHYVSQEIFSEGLFLAVKRITYSGTTVVFEVNSEGKMFGTPYKNQAAISFDILDDKISGYREYLAVIFPVKK